MSKHTPTPWHQNINAKYPIYDDNHNKIAYCLYGKYDQPSLEEANANLAYIVKCVNLHQELIEALTELHSAAVSYRWDVGSRLELRLPNETVNMMSANLLRVEKLIAKAKEIQS